MDILRNTVSTVRFYRPTPTTTVSGATWSWNGATAVPLATPTLNAVEGYYEVKLPYMQNEGTGILTWNFSIPGDPGSPFTEQRIINVVTPYLDDQAVREIHPNATAEEIKRIEAATRHIINAHTGQDFGKRTETITVRGSGNSTLRLPKRLISTSAVNGGDPDLFYEIAGDGWYLNYYPQGVPPVKADYYGLHEHRGGVIHNPNNVSLGVWRANMRYSITGDWGWQHIPSPIIEASKLLVNDYACADQAYRDRYLTSMTAADWRIQFNSGAFAKTGNVRADQLLSNYVVQRGWAVV